MINIYAGMDGVGKSTIANKICEQMKANYTHFSAPKNKEAAKKEYFDFLKIAQDKSKDYICDRFYEGEWTYAPIYRGYTGDYLQEIEDKIIQQQNCMITYVTASLDTIINRCRVRGEDFTKEEHFQLILNNYNNFLMDQKLPFSIIDTTDSTRDHNVKLASEDIEKLRLIWDEKREYAPSNGLTVLPRGNLRAKYFIVGENPDSNISKTSIITAVSRGLVSEMAIAKLKSKGIYLDCWFTTPHSKLEKYIINPQQIITLAEVINGKI